MPRLIAYTDGRDDPAGRFRIGQYVEALGHAGWEVLMRPADPKRSREDPHGNAIVEWANLRSAVWRRRLHRMRDIREAGDCDVTFVSRDVLEGRTLYLRRLLARNRRLVFDFDDAIFLDSDGAPGRKAKQIGWICRRAAWVTAGNEFLAKFARQYTDRVTVLPTAVDAASYRLHATSPTTRLRIGWLGSDRSIRETLFPYVSMLSRLQAELGFEFIVVSRPRPLLPEYGLQWAYVEWSPRTEAGIADLFDVGIMPLADSPFQRGKCGCKLLQYMAAGLPWIASPVGINRALAGSGEHGCLATTDSEWREGILALTRDPELRRRQGAAGRSFVELHYSLERWFPELLKVLATVYGLSR